MADRAIDRRQMLALGAAGAAAGVAALAGAPAGAQTLPGADKPGEDDRLPKGPEFVFAVDIPGLPETSANALEVQIDDLTIDLREMTTGLDVEYRLYGPGAAHWGQAKFTSACTLGGSKELQAWFSDAAKGKNIRKNITVTLLKRDGSEGRRYNLFECFPVRWDAGDYSPSSTVKVETIVVKIGRVEFA
jgi:hypothetical protein